MLQVLTGLLPGIAAGVWLLGASIVLQLLLATLAALAGEALMLWLRGKPLALFLSDGSAIFAGVPAPFTATRYHSLAVVDGTVPEELIVTARTDGGVIMGLRHATLPIHGVQFHPESVLTEGGYRMLGNWLAIAGLPEAAERAKGLSPLLRV